MKVTALWSVCIFVDSFDVRTVISDARTHIKQGQLRLLSSRDARSAVWMRERVPAAARKAHIEGRPSAAGAAAALIRGDG